MMSRHGKLKSNVMSTYLPNIVSSDGKDYEEGKESKEIVLGLYYR